MGIIEEMSGWDDETHDYVLEMLEKEAQELDKKAKRPWNKKYLNSDGVIVVGNRFRGLLWNGKKESQLAFWLRNKFDVHLPNLVYQTQLFKEKFKLIKYGIGFSQHQRLIILSGIEDGLDVSFYAKRCFSYNQMFEIKLGLEDGLDVSEYANPTNTDEQMKYARWRLEGFDVAEQTITRRAK